MPGGGRLILIAWVLAGATPAAAADAQVTPDSRAAGLERCVEPTDFMRKNHMELLLHQRDRTVHRGLRSRKHSLVECVACHAEQRPDGSYRPINAEGQFCAGCHTDVAVDIDCFQCHAARPDAGATGSVMPTTVAMAGANCRR